MPDIDWGSLRSTTPVSRQFGYDRGTPVDRVFIENFLETNAGAIKGRVLEIGDDSYTRQFGKNRVTTADVLHVSANNPRATFVGDLASGDILPSDAFDCAIITQTLHLIYNVRKALRTLRRILKPGGVLLATVPGVTPIAADQWGDLWMWSFTSTLMSRMFGEIFGSDAHDCISYGNSFASLCFLQGIAAEEVSREELMVRDPQHTTLIAVRAVRPASSS